MKFENWLQKKRERFFTEPGSRYVDIKVPHVEEDGRITLEVTGKTCLYDEIQSYADSVDIHKIMQRYANGDMSALQARAAAFMDVTNIPTTMAEMLNTIMDGERFFTELPPDVRDQFNNNFYQFLTEIGSDKFKAAFGITEKVVEPVEPVKEVIENE